MRDLANAIRFLSVDAVERAKSGHPGMPLGMADIATVLFAKHLKFYAKKPKWFNRDRFVLSNGHGSMLLYSLLYLTGYLDITIEDIKNFRQLNSPCAGHPEYGHLEGIETTTGPLGQGLANAVGMAIAEKHLSAVYGKDKVDHYTYVFTGDGDLMEGISHEACSLAGHLGLEKLIVLYDSNHISIDGSTDLSYSDDVQKRFEAYHFDVQTIDGHNYDQIDQAISHAKISDKPSLIICHTKIGYGAGDKEGSEKTHGSPLGQNTIDEMRKRFNWKSEPFEIPDDILHEWRRIGVEHKEFYTDFSIDYEVPESINIKDKFPESMATRQASGLVLETLVKTCPWLVGGSADLTPSNNTKTKDMTDFSKTNPQGTYIHYGVREHAMAGIANGIALHGGLCPYIGTFLVFSDYMRPSIRLSAIMGLPVIYIMTHDSIGLGEDGTTHQPIEHLASLRAMPNLNVFRPADLKETIACWMLVLKDRSCPGLLALTRQNVPTLQIERMQCQYGGYIVEEKGDDYDYVFIATGSEVSIALEVARNFKSYRVISMPCVELFLKQPESYQKVTLSTQKRVIIEAAAPLGWGRLMREGDLFFGMNSFGASAPYQDLYDYFGLSAKKILEKLFKIC